MTETPKHKCLIQDCQNLTTTRLCGEHWFGLSMELRKEWWEVTSYGKNPPTPDLLKRISEYHRHRHDHSADG